MGSCLPPLANYSDQRCYFNCASLIATSLSKMPWLRKLFSAKSRTRVGAVSSTANSAAENEVSQNAKSTVDNGVSPTAKGRIDNRISPTVNSTGDNGTSGISPHITDSAVKA